MSVNGQRYLTGNRGGGAGFNPLAAGAKRYGGGRDFPTMGTPDKLGYAERDRKTAARKSAILKRLQAGQAGRYASPEYLRGAK